MESSITSPDEEPHFQELHPLLAGMSEFPRSRRSFLQRAMVLGASLPTATILARSNSQEALAATAKVDAPNAGTDHQTRGAGKELRILLPQIPTGAAPHSARSTADNLAAAPVIEPLMHLLSNGTLIPNLIEAVPTIANGMLAKDYGSVTFTFLKDLTWSDGEPVTADDLVFTWKWVTTPDNQSSSSAIWGAIAKIEATNAQTAVVTFTQPVANWFEPFTGNDRGSLYPSHSFENYPTNRNDAFLTAPIGTGPYVITDFSQSGEITYAINDRFRDPGKPYFRSISLSVNGDPNMAANAVMAGTSDFAWRLQLDPGTFSEHPAADDAGALAATPGSYVERLRFNFSDSVKIVRGEKSQKDTPHPIFSDPAVRRALSIAVNRGQISARIYGTGEHPTANVLVGLSSYTSTNTGWEFDLDKANQMLDAAGWVLDGETRSKDGVDLVFEICSYTNAVLQQILELIQKDFAKIGAKMTIKQIDPGAFLSIDAGEEQSFYHMYWDSGLWTDGTFTAYPLNFMRRWYAGENGENTSQKANSWLVEREAYDDGVIANTQRYTNADYDALYEKLEKTLDLKEANTLLIKMNDLLVEDAVEIPIVVRSDSYALANRLRADNLALGAFAVPLWNIANWNETDDLLK